MLVSDVLSRLSKEQGEAFLLRDFSDLGNSTEDAAVAGKRRGEILKGLWRKLQKRLECMTSLATSLRF